MTVSELIAALAPLPEGANVFVSVGCEFAPMESADIEVDGDGDVLLGDIDDEPEDDDGENGGEEEDEDD
jgi:hypothetical protein